MALGLPNFAMNLHIDLPETTYTTPLFEPLVLPACRTNGSHINKYVITSSELENLQVLGHGNGGTVYRVRHKKTGAIYALKVLHRDFETTIQSQELEIFSQTDSPYVVGYHGFFETGDGDIEIVMEYMDGGTLDSYIKTHGTVSEDLIADFAKQVLEGFKYLQSKKIVHGDVKPSNLLINKKMEVKIADFGASKIVDHDHAIRHCSSYVGTRAYMSPERFDPEAYGGSVYNEYAADVWSLGLTFMELYVGHYPYLAAGQKPDWLTLMYEICFGDPPSLPDEASLNFKEFIGCCLQKEPDRRWTVEQLLHHPFILKKKDQTVSAPEG